MTVKEKTDLKQAVETLLFIADHPVPLKALCEALGGADSEEVEATITALREEYESRGGGVQVLGVAGGYQMATKPEYSNYVRRLYKDKMTMRLSTAALETLSIISYKQPITRAEVEAIRGVEVIAALETLLEKNLVKVVGRKETVGRPLLYGTTDDFLRQFGLRSVGDLPPIESFETPEVEEKESRRREPGEEQLAVQEETEAAQAEAAANSDETVEPEEENSTGTEDAPASEVEEQNDLEPEADQQEEATDDEETKPEEE